MQKEIEVFFNKKNTDFIRKNSEEVAEQREMEKRIF